MSKRIDIMSAVADRSSQITIANGYSTDIGLNTFYWHDLPLEYGYPALAYRDVAEDYVVMNRLRENILHLELEGLLFSDNPGVDGNKIIGDIIQALGVDPTWSGLCFNTQLVKSETTVETDGQTAVRAVVYVDLFYRTQLWRS